MNVLSPKILKEAYDLAKREEDNLGIKKTLKNYSISDEKDKEIHHKNKSAEHQAQQSSNKKIQDNKHGYKDGNPPKYKKR